jgi:HK97 family phage portal protein
MIRRLLGNLTEERSLSFQDIWGRGLNQTTSGNASGMTVDYDTSFGLTAVYAAIRLLSDTVANLDLSAFYRSQGVEQPFRPLPAWMVQMNTNLANHELIGQVVCSLLLDGNAYIATIRNSTGRVLNLTVLDPTDVEPTVTTDESGFERLTFTSSKAEGEVYTTRDIQMLRGSVIKPGTIKGLSPISAAREMLGANLGIQKYGAAFFGNSATPGAIIEVPGQLSPEGVAQMKGAWNDVHKGAANGHRLAVLTESAKWTQTSLSPEDASYIRGLEHGIQDVARLYGLPPFLLADTSRATSWGSGLHEMNVAMVQYSLRPLANKVSAAFTSIMRSEGIAVAYARFDVGAISRAGNERWETYSKGIQMGVYSIDEVRNLESMAPLPNGEGSRHYIPLNLAPVDGEGFPEE